MVELLREDKVAAVFRKAAKKATSTVVAVPFWGKGAVAALGLERGQKIRIICNLDQPGCNPNVIAEIRSLGIKVWTNPRLHAKIYATSDLAMVGSSNVSTNGMTLEGAAARGWIEANIASTDPAFIAGVSALFDEILRYPETRSVSAADIKRALANRPPPSAPALRSKTLLAACRENPQAFASVYVIPYDEDLSPEAHQLLAAVKADAAAPTAGLNVSDFRRADGYQVDNIPEGAWVVGLDCRRPDRIRFGGCSLATGLRLPVDEQSDLTVVLPRTVRLNGHRWPVAKTEKDELVGVGAKLLRLSGPLTLARVVKLIDRASQSGDA